MASRTLTCSKRFALYFSKPKGIFSPTCALSLTVSLSKYSNMPSLCTVSLSKFSIFVQSFHANRLLLWSQLFSQRILLGTDQFLWVIFFLKKRISILMSSASSIQIMDNVFNFFFLGFLVFFCTGRFEILSGLHCTTQIMVTSPIDLGLWECLKKALSLIGYKVSLKFSMFMIHLLSSNLMSNFLFPFLKDQTFSDWRYNLYSIIV